MVNSIRKGALTLMQKFTLFIRSLRKKHFNPYVTNDESNFIYRGIGSIFIFTFIFFFDYKFMLSHNIAPDGTPRSATSHLGLFYLPTSDKKDARLIWVKPRRNLYATGIVTLTSYANYSVNFSREKGLIQLYKTAIMKRNVIIAFRKSYAHGI